MLAKMVQLIVGVFVSFIFVHWTSISMNGTLTETIVSFVLAPVNFFFGTLLLFSSIVINGELIQYITFKGREYLKGGDGKKFIIPLLMGLCMIISNIMLFHYRVVPTIILLSFSFLYGMISVINKKVRMRNF